MASASGSAVKWVEPTKADKPPKDADLKTAWLFLRNGVDHIMTRLDMGMSYSYYILLYTAIYDFCTQNRPSIGSFGAGAAGRGGASLQGADLYRSLHSYLSEHCKGLRDKSKTMTDLELIRFYAKEWNRYTEGAGYVNKLFNYLNKHWVKREKDEGRKDVYTVYTLALVAWKKFYFLDFVSEAGGVSRLTQALLRQIEAHRNGEQVETGLLRDVIQSYVSLGLDEADVQRQQLDTYKEHFQAPFIEATRLYYRAEAKAFIGGNSIPDYIKKAEDRLQEEVDRVNVYINESTLKELKETCEEVLISEHVDVITDEFQPLLDQDRVDDLERMYGLLARISNGLEPLRVKFETHVKKAGNEAVKKVIPLQGAVNEAGKAETLDPKAYIKALLDVHDKYESVVKGPFRSELGFGASLDKACRVFVNRNDAATTATKSPELLASYVDSLLKKSNKDFDAESLEANLVQAMTIFAYIDDKDVFQKFYQRKLGTRLVQQLSASDDSESSMITKLKDACGFEYTNRLTRMFTDVELSRDLTEKFKEKERSRSDGGTGIDFNVQVLGETFWALPSTSTDFAMPNEVRSVCERFTKYHGDIHSGRKLSWLWNMQRAELKTTYLPQKYIFMCTAFQMGILCQFNQDDSLHFKQLKEATKLSDPILQAQLSLLVKAKILLKDGDNYDLNLNFKSKKIRVNLAVNVKSEQKAEQSEVLHAVDEDRKFIYQATIVRIMKARKTMKHTALIHDVTSQISTKFTPKVPEIKKAIDYLLDKEYLERSETDNDTYQYLA